MSFFGGGTDMENYFKENGGAVLSTTFDKYCYVNVRHLPRFFEYSTEISYAITERVTSVDDIKHPAVRNAMKMLDMHEIRLSYEADLPARSGLGTSSSFAVGMLNAFYALKGKYADKKKLADEAIYLERVLCGEAGGWQDQIAASFGGFNRINFGKDGYEVLPVIISPERKRTLNDNLLMFFTGFIQYLPVPVLTAIVISALLGAVEFGLAKRLFRQDKRHSVYSISFRACRSPVRSS